MEEVAISEFKAKCADLVKMVERGASRFALRATANRLRSLCRNAGGGPSGVDCVNAGLGHRSWGQYLAGQ